LISEETGWFEKEKKGLAEIHQSRIDQGTAAHAKLTDLSKLGNKTPITDRMVADFAAAGSQLAQRLRHVLADEMPERRTADNLSDLLKTRAKEMTDILRVLETEVIDHTRAQAATILERNRSKQAPEPASA
jgi:hypothetical protein